ncbi:MAG: coproporphyrinogen III oxidase, partial [Verrucomicrobiota bacterium]
MSTITIAPLPKTAGPPMQKETTAGNYFVANYPPFAFWKAEAIPDFLAGLDHAPRPGVPLGLYTHIPFCRKRCHFCYFRV